MFRYLADFRVQLQQECLGEVEHGGIEMRRQGEFAGRMSTLGELSDLQWGMLTEFYGIGDQEEGKQENE